MAAASCPIGYSQPLSIQQVAPPNDLQLCAWRSTQHLPLQCLQQHRRWPVRRQRPHYSSSSTAAAAAPTAGAHSCRAQQTLCVSRPLGVAAPAASAAKVFSCLCLCSRHQLGSSSVPATPTPSLRQQQQQRYSSCCAAAGAAGALGSGLSAAGGLLDMTAVSAATAASFKLLFLCGVVAWMSHR